MTKPLPRQEMPTLISESGRAPYVDVNLTDRAFGLDIAHQLNSAASMAAGQLRQQQAEREREREQAAQVLEADRIGRLQDYAQRKFAGEVDPATGKPVVGQEGYFNLHGQDAMKRAEPLKTDIKGFYDQLSAEITDPKEAERWRIRGGNALREIYNTVDTRRIAETENYRKSVVEGGFYRAVERARLVPSQADAAVEGYRTDILPIVTRGADESARDAHLSEVRTAIYGAAMQTYIRTENVEAAHMFLNQPATESDGQGGQRAVIVNDKPATRWDLISNDLAMKEKLQPFINRITAYTATQEALKAGRESAFVPEDGLDGVAAREAFDSYIQKAMSEGKIGIEAAMAAGDYFNQEVARAADRWTEDSGKYLRRANAEWDEFGKISVELEQELLKRGLLVSWQQSKSQEARSAPKTDQQAIRWHKFLMLVYSVDPADQPERMKLRNADYAWGAYIKYLHPTDQEQASNIVGAVFRSEGKQLPMLEEAVKFVQGQGAGENWWPSPGTTEWNNLGPDGWGEYDRGGKGSARIRYEIAENAIRSWLADWYKDPANKNAPPTMADIEDFYNKRLKLMVKGRRWYNGRRAMITVTSSAASEPRWDPQYTLVNDPKHGFEVYARIKKQEWDADEETRARNGRPNVPFNARQALIWWLSRPTVLGGGGGPSAPEDTPAGRRAVNAAADKIIADKKKLGEWPPNL